MNSFSSFFQVMVLKLMADMVRVMGMAPMDQVMVTLMPKFINCEEVQTHKPHDHQCSSS